MTRSVTTNQIWTDKPNKYAIYHRYQIVKVSDRDVWYKMLGSPRKRVIRSSIGHFIKSRELVPHDLLLRKIINHESAREEN